MDFNPLSDAFAQNPYPTYARLREAKSPVFFEEADCWLLSRYEDVDHVACQSSMVRSPEAFMNPEAIAAQKREMNWHDMPNHEKYVQFSLLESDGDIHRQLRKLVLREFTKSYVEQHRKKIETYVSGLLDQLLDKQDIEFIEDLASQVPGRIIGNLLGVPDEDCPQLRIWSENVVQFYNINRTDEHKQLAESATTEFLEYLVALVAERSKKPRNDLISTLIAARDAGQMTEVELISTCMLILMAGHGSTIDVLGSGLLTLLRNPDQLTLLRNNPHLMPTAIQEMFRYESPLPFFHRYATREIEVGGMTYPKGTKFGLLYGSANRDPDFFPMPDMFDVRREPNRHIAFGRGAHLCLGNHLSRLDMEIVFSQLLARTRSIEMTIAEPVFKKGLSVRGPVALPLRLVT